MEPRKAGGLYLVYKYMLYVENPYMWISVATIRTYIAAVGSGRKPILPLQFDIISKDCCDTDTFIGLPHT